MGTAALKQIGRKGLNVLYIIFLVLLFGSLLFLLGYVLDGVNIHG